MDGTFAETWRRLVIASIELSKQRDFARQLAVRLSGLSREEINTWKFEMVMDYLDLAARQNIVIKGKGKGTG